MLHIQSNEAGDCQSRVLRTTGRRVGAITTHMTTWLRTDRPAGMNVRRTQGEGTFVTSSRVPGTAITNNIGTLEGRDHFSQTTQDSPTSWRTTGEGTFLNTEQIPGTSLYRTSGYANGHEVFNISSSPTPNGEF